MVNELIFEDTEEMNDFLLYDRGTMHDMVVEAIVNSYTLALDNAFIAIFYIKELDVRIYATSNKDNWKESLTFALNYFIEVEKYEKCATIKKLIENIEHIC